MSEALMNAQRAHYAARKARGEPLYVDWDAELAIAVRDGETARDCCKRVSAKYRRTITANHLNRALESRTHIKLRAANRSEVARRAQRNRLRQVNGEV